jgi:hypothetical protein
MKTRMMNQNNATDSRLHQAIKNLNRAEVTAWALFIGVGVLYVILSLVIAR